MGTYEECKGRLRDILQKMEISSADEGMAIFNAFVKDYEASLYNEIGKLTRHLHDSLTAFQTDEKISILTRKDIPSARERLKYVVEMTEQAAQKVLGIIEKCIPISLVISQGASSLHGKWSNKSSAGEKLVISSSTRAFLTSTKENATILHGCLTEILVAQEYQDITGQIIKKVIDLVQEVENNLLRLIKLTGSANAPHDSDLDNDIKANGPCVPGIDDEVVRAAGQDDVDQLLAGLGF
jgi:chemotaxis protein CheZ